jgi:hypothetical protein
MRKRAVRAVAFEPEASNAAQLGAVPDISNLAACVEEVRQAAVDGDPGPPDPTDFHDLRGRLEASRFKLPPLYRDAVFTPFVAKLDSLGQSGFNQILIGDPTRERIAGLMLDIAHAILQNGEDFEPRATDGFQEVTSDLFDGFLSAEDRKAVEPPDEGVIAPLVKWGKPDFGPYTWPVDATLNFGVGAPIVNLPPANARRGLLAWSALAHETGGHDILHADTGLLQELAENVNNGLREAGLDDPLPEYWSDRIDETASDVLGILNMGPAAGIGLIGYFRGLNAAFGAGPTLRNEGRDTDPHPADIVRGFLAAACVRRLKFGGAHAWAAVIEGEALNDLTTVRLSGVEISEAAARQSADVVAQVIMHGRLQSLQNHPLDYIQNWRNTDERIVQQLRRLLTIVGQLPTRIESGVYAAHVVAAAVTAGLSQGADTSTLFDRMLVLLKKMHDANPSWGPLFVAHPGDIAADYAYMNYAVL